MAHPRRNPVVERPARLLEGWRVELGGAVHGRIAGRHQQIVPVAQGHVEHAGEQ
jgi:hypothetical protein